MTVQVTWAMWARLAMLAMPVQKLTKCNPECSFPNPAFERMFVVNFVVCGYICFGPIRESGCSKHLHVWSWDVKCFCHGYRCTRVYGTTWHMNALEGLRWMCSRRLAKVRLSNSWVFQVLLRYLGSSCVSASDTSLDSWYSCHFAGRQRYSWEPQHLKCSQCNDQRLSQ